jgi:putative peptide zinc metalloprotease protein
MIVCTVYTLLFNANPLLRFDGYYMLSDLLEIPNLRQKSATYLQYLFDRYALGLQRDPPAVQNADPHTLTIYGVLRVCYRLFIVLSIGFFLYSIFEPLGVVMWVTSLYGMFFMPLYRHAKQLARHYRSGGLQIKYTILMAVVIGLFAAGWFFPIDYTIEAPCVVAPARISVIRAPFEAIVEKVFVSEGEMVEEGDPLIRISRPELEIRCHQLRALIEETEGRMRFALGRQPAVYAMELREKKKLQEELGKLREDIERLTLRASHDGRIINVHNAEVKASFGRHGFVPFPRKDVPLALNDFQGMTVSPGTGLVAVADTSGYRFESYVYEYNLSDISIGDPIFSVVRGIPEMVYESRVKDISAVDVRSIENIGITLADVGYIPVEPDESGEKKPLVTLYKVRSRLLSKGTSEAGQSATTGKGQLEVGMTGKARIQYGRGPMGRYFFKRILMGLRLRLQKVS